MFFMIAVIKLYGKNELFTHKRLKDGWAAIVSYVIGRFATQKLENYEKAPEVMLVAMFWQPKD